MIIHRTSTPMLHDNLAPATRGNLKSVDLAIPWIKATPQSVSNMTPPSIQQNWMEVQYSPKKLTANGPLKNGWLEDYSTSF